MACGRPPFVGGAGRYRRRAHLHAAPPYPQDLAPDMPAGLSALIATMLAKHPEARPQRMTTVSQTLDEILRTLGGSPRALRCR